MSTKPCCNFNSEFSQIIIAKLNEINDRLQKLADDQATSFDEIVTSHYGSSQQIEFILEKLLDRLNDMDNG